MGLFNKKTKITAYALISKNVKNKFLTITKNLKEASEYAMLITKLQHHDHFNMWCTFRELDVSDIKNWLDYYENCVTDDEKDELQIIKVKYDLENILAILRMFGSCFPLGCSFETDVERTYFNAILEEASAQEATETTSRTEETSPNKEHTSDGN